MELALATLTRSSESDHSVASVCCLDLKCGPPAAPSLSGKQEVVLCERASWASLAGSAEERDTGLPPLGTRDKQAQGDRQLSQRHKVK